MSKLDDKTTLNYEGRPALATGELSAVRVSLVIYHRDGAKVVSLAKGQPVVVGRAFPADAVVPDLSLSRRHASFLWEDEGVFVEDVGSTNGTVVRGERIAERTLLHTGETAALGAVRVAVTVLAPNDELSQGLDDHDRFVDRIDEEIVRARTFGRRLAVVMLRALSSGDSHVSRWFPRVRSSLRPVDHLTLYGPGAVLVLLPEIDPSEAERMASSFVRATFEGEPPLVAGLAFFPDAGRTADELIDSSRTAARKATPSRPLHSATARGDGAGERQVVVVSPAMHEVYSLVQRVARSPIPVLVLGETGTGKEVVARAIHEAGPRKDKPLRAINCAAIPGTLLESALFGHEKGAFTGAERTTAGVFEQADGGTVFLDEIGELSAPAQAALLRVLETKRVTRVGGTEEKAVDVRVVAATHRDLEAMTQEGSFRLDLLFRLNTMTMRVPPLRERPEEIEPLAEMFLREAARASSSSVNDIDADARRALRAYAWPGNVRELRNAVERAVVVCAGDVITPLDLSERIRGAMVQGMTQPPPELSSSESGVDVEFRDRIRKYEIDLIVDALRRSGGNQTEAAKMLRMPLRTLVHKIKTLGIKKSYGA